MEIRYCCDNAKTTAYLRYSRRVERVTHQTQYIDGVGTCVSVGTTTMPDNTTVPSKYSHRFFTINNGILRKHYLCQECLKKKVIMLGYFKTKAEAYAATVTLHLE